MESGNRPDLSALRMNREELEYRPRRRWLGWVIAVLLLGGAAAWAFLAPAHFLLTKVQTTRDPTPRRLAHPPRPPRTTARTEPPTPLHALSTGAGAVDEVLAPRHYALLEEVGRLDYLGPMSIPRPLGLAVVLAAVGCRHAPARSTAPAGRADERPAAANVLDGCTTQRQESVGVVMCGPVMAMQVDGPPGASTDATRRNLERFAGQFPPERTRHGFGPVVIGGRPWPGVHVFEVAAEDREIATMAAVEAASGITRLVSCATRDPAAQSRCSSLLEYLAVHRVDGTATASRDP
jgi:hypothetical protein